jgi:hypothetical protein
MVVIDELVCTTRVSLPQGYHSHIRSKLLSVRVYGTQPERRDNTITVNKSSFKI